MKRYLKNIFYISINIIIIYFFTLWIIENIDIQKLKLAFLSVPIITVFIVFIVNFLTLFFYANRLMSILDKSFFTSFSLINLGYGFNAILPFRMGEIVKILYAKKIYKIPSSQLIVSIFIEKILDISFLGLLLSLFLVFSVQNYISVKMLFIIFILVIGVVVFIYIARKSILKLQNSENIEGKIKIFLLSVYKYSKGHNIKKLILKSGLIWVANLIAIYITFNTLLSVEFSFINAIGLLLVIVLSIAIPATPAGVGLFEAGIVAYLVTILNVDSEVALMSAILFHLTVTVPQFAIMIAILSFARYNQKVELRRDNIEKFKI